MKEAKPASQAFFFFSVVLFLFSLLVLSKYILNCVMTDCRATHNVGDNTQANHFMNQGFYYVGIPFSGYK